MKAICVDDEIHVMNYTVSVCRSLKLLDDVRGFTHAEEALKWASENRVDLAILDIDMPEMNGIVLAEKIREINPFTSVIFLTAYARFALDAYSVHPSGYLLKPFDENELAREVDYALAGPRKQSSSRISVRTFGSFEMRVDGVPVSFRRSKARELLAYLIDRNGAGITRREAFGVLWEDRPYDQSMQKQLDVVIRSMRDTLREYGIDSIFEMKNHSLSILPELLDCDLYRFLKGDPEAANAYQGEYMVQFSWASETEARLDRLLE